MAYDYLIEAKCEDHQLLSYLEEQQGEVEKQASSSLLQKGEGFQDLPAIGGDTTLLLHRQVCTRNLQHIPPTNARTSTRCLPNSMEMTTIAAGESHL